MTALILDPPLRQYVVFPLVVHWQQWYECLPLYFPALGFGLVIDAPPERALVSLLSPPRQQVWQALAKHFQPGELSQWQAYMTYLAAQEDQDELDLQAAIRGNLAPALPPQSDGETLWSLAYQLEQVLAEKAAGLQKLAAQEQALDQLLAEIEPGEQEILTAAATFSPALTSGPADIPLARLRLHFWKEILRPKLEEPWTMVVLEPAAGESSPRFLWENAREAGQEFWQTRFYLPADGNQAGSQASKLEAMELTMLFRKTLAGLLHALTAEPAKTASWRESLQRLVADRLWPESGRHQAPAVCLEIFSWPEGVSELQGMPSPMVFLSPVD